MKREGIIIGGGAAGMIAAIIAAENGAAVTIIEHMPRVGKKILSTGNGKCNLTNLYMKEECYRCGEAGYPMKVIKHFGISETLRFFSRLGVLTTDRNGYVYPHSGQAQTILDALRGKIEELGVQVVYECEPTEIQKNPNGFLVKTNAGTYSGDFLILACGSMAAKNTGSDGSGYELAKKLGHKIKKPLPALVQLKCKGDFFKTIAGVRTEADVSLFIMDKNGQLGARLASDYGELQLTDYGISGIPVFQVSRYAAEALDQKKRVAAVLNFLPDYQDVGVFELLEKQKYYLKERTADEFLNGIFHKKLAALFIKMAGIKPEMPVAELSNRKLWELCSVIREFTVEVTATNPYEKAQVCMGGVHVRDVDPDMMESRLVPNLYFAGEILDVDGICGGYNLQWAWSSGYLAGISAAKRR